MPSLMTEFRDYMAMNGRSFDDFDHTIVTHPLTQYGGDSGALKRRVEELHAIGFGRILLTLPQDMPDAQWRTLTSLHQIVQAFA